MSKIDYWKEEIRAMPEYELSRNIHEKIQWLNLHILEYIQRWTGLAMMNNVNVKATLANDLFFLIVAATALLNDLLDSEDELISFPCLEWERFANSIEFIQDYPKKEHVGLILETFTEYLSIIENN